MSKAPPKYRSRFEGRVAVTLSQDFQYEAKRMPYTKVHHYVPDWINEATKEISERLAQLRPVAG